MFKPPIGIFSVEIPTRGAFQWRVTLALVTLYLIGNLAGVPLSRKMDAPIEPVWFWGIVTLLSALVIALSLIMANCVGLGAPLLEGSLTKADRPLWIRSGLALILLCCVIASPVSLAVNLNVDRMTYPFGWELLGASFKAGVVEELGYRFFMLALFVWVGSFLKHDLEGRPHPTVFWVSILLTALLFGWAHVAARLGHPTAAWDDYACIMALNSGIGFYFGWIFWKLGLEWAIMAHFAYDAFVSMILIPVYIVRSPLVWAILIAALITSVVISWRMLSFVQWHKDHSPNPART
jgi:hypothetical protein